MDIPESNGGLIHAMLPPDVPWLLLHCAHSCGLGRSTCGLTHYFLHFDKWSLLQQRRLVLEFFATFRTTFSLLIQDINQQLINGFIHSRKTYLRAVSHTLAISPTKGIPFIAYLGTRHLITSFLNFLWPSSLMHCLYVVKPDSRRPLFWTRHSSTASCTRFTDSAGRRRPVVLYSLANALTSLWRVLFFF